VVGSALETSAPSILVPGPTSSACRITCGEDRREPQDRPLALRDTGGIETSERSKRKRLAQETWSDKKTGTKSGQTGSSVAWFFLARGDVRHDLAARSVDDELAFLGHLLDPVLELL